MIEMRGSWRDVTPVGMALARLMQVFLLGVTPHVIALQPVKKNGHFGRFGLPSAPGAQHTFRQRPKPRPIVCGFFASVLFV